MTASNHDFTVGHDGLIQLSSDEQARLLSLPRPQKAIFLDLVKELEHRAEQRQFFHFFPDKTHTFGDTKFWARNLYPRHLEFFEASRSYREICFLAANRIGKTVAGAFAMTCHLTGLYPDWWKGKTFAGPIQAWAASDTTETTRDIIQLALFGEVATSGSVRRVSGKGMIPGNLINRCTWRRGVDDAISQARISHASGGESKLAMKTYEQGRKTFQGTAKHVVWLDEECPQDIYGESVIRTATTGGIVMLTFTPLNGMTPVVLDFLPELALDQMGTGA